LTTTAFAALRRGLTEGLRHHRLAGGYAALLVLMSASVFVGSALAWESPWL